MIDAGIATDAINVERHDRMNSKTVRHARTEPDNKWFSISCRAAKM